MAACLFVIGFALFASLQTEAFDAPRFWSFVPVAFFFATLVSVPCACVFGMLVEVPKLVWIKRQRIGVPLLAQVGISIAAGMLMMLLATIVSAFVEGVDWVSAPDVTYRLSFMVVAGAIGGLCSGFAWWRLVSLGTKPR